ncbi:tyrosine-type recombinase/integrase [Candidatus Bathyarchaeota archaeon]|nr:tyrosine-type recombinase/integrase [Candidatus Bathyarchaeota archaeon]
MEKFDVVQNWLDNVAYSHSNSPNTEREYRRNFKRFSQFINKTPEQILKEYEKSTDREFKRKYARYVRALIGNLVRKGYTNSSVKVIIAATKSFFKYNDLPLAHIPTARNRVVFHNRDITKEEIVEILKIARPRDRIFYCMMAQTGLRPSTICALRLKHIQPDFDKDIIPNKIDVPEDITKGSYRSYFTFMGPESVKHLKTYLKTRPNLVAESYLFTKHGTEEQLDQKSVSHRFRDAVLKLKRKGIMDYQQKAKGKPGTIRLYSLRKFFRKFANQMGFEHVQFLMGHIVNVGQEEHYRPKDPEFYRQLYKEKAMPHLRLETPTATETDKVIQSQAEEIEALRKYVEQVEENRRLGDETIKLTLEVLPPLLKYVEKNSKDEESLKTIEEARKRLLQLDKAYEKLKSDRET